MLTCVCHFGCKPKHISRKSKMSCEACEVHKKTQNTKLDNLVTTKLVRTTEAPVMIKATSRGIAHHEATSMLN